MTYKDAVKAVEDGQNVRLWTGEEYLHPEYVKKILECSHEIHNREEYEEHKKLLETIYSDKWSVYTKADLEWETGHYRRRLEHLNCIHDILVKELLGDDYYNEYMKQFSSQKQTAADALHVLYNLKRNLKIFQFTTIVFLAATIIALIV